MMCASCSKLAYLFTKKPCARCKGEVVITIASICEICSTNGKVCSVCLKNIVAPRASKGCGCGKK